MSVETYMNLGIAHAKEGKYDLALENFKKVIELDPTNSEAYGRKGAVYIERMKQQMLKKEKEKND